MANFNKSNILKKLGVTIYSRRQPKEPLVIPRIYNCPCLVIYINPHLSDKFTLHAMLATLETRISRFAFDQNTDKLQLVLAKNKPQNILIVGSKLKENILQQISIDNSEVFVVPSPNELKDNPTKKREAFMVLLKLRSKLCPQKFATPP